MDLIHSPFSPHPAFAHPPNFSVFRLYSHKHNHLSHNPFTQSHLSLCLIPLSLPLHPLSSSPLSLITNLFLISPQPPHFLFTLHPGPTFPLPTHCPLKTCLLLLLLLPPNHHLIPLLPQPKRRMALPSRSSHWRARRPLSQRRKKRSNQWRRSTWPKRRSRCCRANWPDWLYRLGRLVRNTHKHMHTQTHILYYILLYYIILYCIILFEYWF